jgi:hypothetical protein
VSSARGTCGCTQQTPQGSACLRLCWHCVVPPRAPQADPPPSAALAAAVMRGVGAAVARMHDGGLVHGDLTTSNLLVREAQAQAEAQQEPAQQAAQGQQAQGQQAAAQGPAPEVVVIDFGLAYNSTIPEDKAVSAARDERGVLAASCAAAAGWLADGAAGQEGVSGYTTLSTMHVDSACTTRVHALPARTPRLTPTFPPAPLSCAGGPVCARASLHCRARRGGGRAVRPGGPQSPVRRQPPRHAPAGARAGTTPRRSWRAWQGHPLSF